MNKVTLIGRLTADPEFRTTANNTSVSSFTLAVDRRFKDANGNKQTDFIKCVAWKTTADFIVKYFKKGNKMALVGSLQVRSYEQDGQKRTISEVIVDEVEFCESKAENSGNTDTKPVDYGDGGKLPFEL